MVGDEGKAVADEESLIYVKIGGRHCNVPVKDLRYVHDWQGMVGGQVVWTYRSGKPMPPLEALDALFFVETYYLGDEEVKRAPHGLLLKGQLVMGQQGQIG